MSEDGRKSKFQLNFKVQRTHSKFNLLLTKTMSSFAAIPPYPPSTPGAENKAGTFWPNLSSQTAVALSEVEKWFYENNLQIADLALEFVDPKLILLRYLRANNLDVKKTIAHIEKNIQWRKEMNVLEIMKMTPEQILGCDMPALTKVFPHWHFGFDKTGRPVIYKQYGKFDASHVKTLTGGSYDNVVKYHIWEQENCLRMCMRKTAETGHLVETISGIVDVKDMRMFQITRDFLNLTKQIADVDQHQYPETLGRIYIINTPTVFPMVWRLVKPWLDPIVTAKIFIFGGPKEYEPALIEFIGKDNLPSNYGGTQPALNCNVHPYAETLRDFYGNGDALQSGSMKRKDSSELTDTSSVLESESAEDAEVMMFANGL